jgi:hypothetical protein
MYDLSSFGLKEMIESGKELRLAAQDATTMQEGAAHIVNLLYDRFESRSSAQTQDQPTGQPSCALVRCFMTHPFATLPGPLKKIALTKLPTPEPLPSMRCLTLLASRGENPEWNSPATSLAHQVIPLPTAEIVEQAPMIARLIVQMGLTVKDLVHSQPGFLLDLDKQTFNVFHVEEALGSEFVPAQENFIIPYRVRSVVGFGGLLPSGELFAVVLFAKVSVSRETAALFRTLALSVKLALLPFAGRRVFNE